MAEVAHLLDHDQARPSMGLRLATCAPTRRGNRWVPLAWRRRRGAAATSGSREGVPRAEKTMGSRQNAAAYCVLPTDSGRFVAHEVVLGPDWEAGGLEDRELFLPDDLVGDAHRADVHARGDLVHDLREHILGDHVLGHPWSIVVVLQAVAKRLAPADALLDDPVKALEGAATDEQDVRRVDLDEVLVGMLAPALRGHVGDCALDDLQERLLHALTTDITGDGGVVALA